MRDPSERLKMGSQFTEDLLRFGVPESKKFELIYRKGPSLSAEDLDYTVARLREDCRYGRILGALINASRNEGHAIEELFSMNAVTPDIVTGCKWLYTAENRGLISEAFVRSTLPFASSSSQKKIVNKISKWVTNTELGDKLWTIVRSRSIELSTLLLGACSNDLILREVLRNNKCLSMAQMLDILKKRFESGVELVHKIAEAGKLEQCRINGREMYRYILKKDLDRGMELLLATRKENNFQFGRHFTRKLLPIISADEAKRNQIMKYSELKQRVVAKHATAELYLECFLQKFERAEGWPREKELVKWLNPLKDRAKLAAIETWHQYNFGKALVEAPEDVPEIFYYLLDEETLQQIVTHRITNETQSPSFSNLKLLRLQSLLPDDEESFRKQKECLEGQSHEKVRREIYVNMLKSVIILRRPQYLKRRLSFLVRRTRNDYRAQSTLCEILCGALVDQHKFNIDNDTWPLIKEMIDLQILSGNQSFCAYIDLLMVALKKVSPDQQTLLSAIMEELNRLQVSQGESVWNLKLIPEDKSQFFWNGVLAYREALEETKTVLNGGACPDHLQYFYAILASNKKETRKYIQAYPKTMSILRLIVSNALNPQNFQVYDKFYLFWIYELIQPFLKPSDAISEGLAAEIEKEKTKKRKADVLKAFRKSRIINDDVVDVFFPGRRPYNEYLRLCGRSLLHADPEVRAKWLTMLSEITKENSRTTRTSAAFNLLAMISPASSFRAEVIRNYPEEAKFDLNGVELEDAEIRKRINLAYSIRYFDNSEIASEMLLHFMKGDYLQPSLKAFNHHVTRLPTRKVADLLQERIVKRDSSVSVRKNQLRAFFKNTLMFDEELILGVAQKLCDKDEPDDVKKQTLIAIYGIVKVLGEEGKWPLLKTCLDSIDLKNRACFTDVLKRDESIDAHIPVNLEYLMRKLIESSESGFYDAEYTAGVTRRVSRGVPMLSLDCIFAILEKLKTKNWSHDSNSLELAGSIVKYCGQNHADALKKQLRTFGETKRVDLINASKLAKWVVQRNLYKSAENSLLIIDFFLEVFGSQPAKYFRQLRLFELTKVILRLLPEEESEKYREPIPREILRTAVRTTASSLEKHGKEMFGVLVQDLIEVLNIALPELLSDETLVRSIYASYHSAMSSLETIIFLWFLSQNFRYVPDAVVGLSEILLEHKDENVRTAMMYLLAEHPVC